uniref:SCP domain-containing protein n=1 Tax=Heterorhabditis bacteriophora TaxID=37862 RepID=A0A1I7WNK7_HETBA
MAIIQTKELFLRTKRPPTADRLFTKAQNNYVTAVCFQATIDRPNMDVARGYCVYDGKRRFERPDGLLEGYSREHRPFVRRNPFEQIGSDPRSRIAWGHLGVTKGDQPHYWTSTTNSDTSDTPGGKAILARVVSANMKTKHLLTFYLNMSITK